MKVYFEEDITTKVSIEGRGEYMAGGLQVELAMLPFFNDHTLDSKFFSENDVSVDNLHRGNLVGISTLEFGEFPLPFIVGERESKEDEEDTRIENLIRLYYPDESVTEQVILTREDDYSGYSASYYDYEYKGSRFVTGDDFSVYLLPDILVAESISDDLVSKIIPYSL